MLRTKTSYSSTKAKDYFTESLNRGDYYGDGQEMPGSWGGKLAEQFGLSAEVNQKDFFSLCENKHPRTGEKLTPRTKDGRRVGYDINFHVPKSVSLLYSIGKDTRILTAFRESVGATMQDLEAEMRTRVRVSGKQEDRLTGNGVWATFIHTTARPVNGFPDPLLHAHCFTFNVTHDPEEGRYKAGEFSEIKRQASMFEARFHLRMSERMQELGYGILRNGKYWEVEGVSKAVADRFSRRSKEIESAIKEQGFENHPQWFKSEMGARTRQRKQKGVTAESLKERWHEWAGDAAVKEIGDVVRKSKAAIGQSKDDGARKDGKAFQPTARMLREANAHLRFILEHEFERKSAIRERELKDSLYRDAVGKIPLSAVDAALANEPLVRRKFRGETWVTPKEVLLEEQKMLAFESSTRGRFSPIVKSDYVHKSHHLNAEQLTAVSHVLNSYDQVMLIRGGAGVGKTTLMREAISEIKKAGQNVVVLSPLSDPARQTLPKEGFPDASTVARFLIDKNFQAEAKCGVIWIDEAGLLGTRQMLQLFDVAKKLNARIVLSGDERQHSSVLRGDGVRLLVEEGGMQSAEVRFVVRQKGEYRDACELINRGDLDGGFAKLDSLGFIKEVTGEDAIRKVHEAVAADYLDAIKAGRSALAVSPTKDEGKDVNVAIRTKLKDAKVIKAKDREFEKLTPLHLTEAEKKRASSYAPGNVIEFHGKTRGRDSGNRSEVLKVSGDTVWVSGLLGAATPLPLKLGDANKFSVYEKDKLDLAVGDSIRITRNGKSSGDLLGFLPDRRKPLRNGGQLAREIGKSLGFSVKQIRKAEKRLNNGSVLKVIGFVPLSGDIVLSNGTIISKNYGHFSYAYCSTSVAAQSKGVDRVIVSQTSKTFNRASNRAQFLVSVTRGIESCTVYTDSKSGLLHHIHTDSDRVSASELVREGTEEAMESARQYREHLARGLEEERSHGFDLDR